MIKSDDIETYQVILWKEKDSSMKNVKILLYLLLVVAIGCRDKNNNLNFESQQLTIFTVNDVHGQLENFAKIKHIVDAEKANGNVLFLSGGDIFSGNPVVDSHEEKGYPIIDMMNRVGVDATVIGNHEYDYGESYLKDRIAQAEFDFICANVSTEGSSLPPPDPFVKITIGDVDVLLLGLVETNGSDNETIPSTHPWRVKNLTFSRPETVVEQYADLKNEQDADLFIALTHIGHSGNSDVMGDYQLAQDYPYFDLIVGGHSHREIDTSVNNIPIYQAGSYLRKLGRIDLTLKNKKPESIKYTLIDLDTYPDQDSEVADLIAEYNDQPYLKEVVGYSHAYHERPAVGCFYTDALLGKMNVDLAFQNTGGVRSDLDEGDITRQEIFEISPFNNGTVIYEMTVAQVQSFLKKSGSGFYYAGLSISQAGPYIRIRDLDGNLLDDDSILKIGVNDYIPAVHEPYFPSNGQIQELTAAETLIAYLVDIDDQVNYPDCNRYFRFEE